MGQLRSRQTVLRSRCGLCVVNRAVKRPSRASVSNGYRPACPSATGPLHFHFLPPPLILTLMGQATRCVAQSPTWRLRVVGPHGMEDGSTHFLSGHVEVLRPPSVRVLTDQNVRGQRTGRTKSLRSLFAGRVVSAWPTISNRGPSARLSGHAARRTPCRTPCGALRCPPRCVTLSSRDRLDAWRRDDADSFRDVAAERQRSTSGPKGRS
jgi:hypothetical protein